MTARTWVLGLLLVATAASAQERSAAPLAPRDLLLHKPLTAAPAPHPGQTRCELCHSPEGWSQAAFAHDRTGFPLRGEHVRAECKACHTSARFSDPLSPQCASCHRDTHRGELGQRCEGCHTPTNWSSTFSADAHRRTNFPLTGRHALIPCTECHGEVKDRQFTRTTTPCVGCHQQDFDRTAATSVDHLRAGFPTDCRQCHQSWSFAGARFPGHDSCFPLTGGSHAGLTCASCHPVLAGVALSGTCRTAAFSCTGCHTHSCAQTDSEHTRVAGYQCKDQKCFECHRLSAGGR